MAYKMEYDFLFSFFNSHLIIKIGSGSECTNKLQMGGFGPSNSPIRHAWIQAL